MNRIFRNFLLLSMLVLAFSACRKKAFDEYYSRPATLANPIYQRLGELGNFKSLLTVIDKSGYKDILSTSGYWTMFAANDSAFAVYLKGRGLSTADQLDSATCAQIVTYSLAYNANLRARLGDYQSTTGWVANQAFKRKTPNYVGFYTDTTNGSTRLALSSNTSGGYVAGDNNNKSIPYFLDNFMTAKFLTATDYNYFYPNTTYTGFNVVDAKVTQQDIFTENGYINVVDKVLLPLPNIDQYLAGKPQYSLFKSLYDKYMVSFVQNAAATTKYFNITGKSDNVYIKTYNPLLAFSPNSENYNIVGGNDAQSDGFSIFVPTNDVLQDYINSVILEKYTSLDQIPLQIIVDLLNAHMWTKTVWPTKFTTTNSQNEPARFDKDLDIIDKKVLSNGIFYGTNKVQQADIFRSVYGKAYLDPAYSLMTRALDLDAGLGLVIKNPNQRFTLIMMSDKLLRSQGYDWNNNYSTWQYTTPGTSTVTIGGAAVSQLYRILETSVVPTPNRELDNVGGSGIVEAYNGEYIKYNANKFTSSRNVDYGSTVPVTNGTVTKFASNGNVWYVDSLLNFSTSNVGTHLKNLAGATAAASDYFTFYQYLSKSSLYITTATATANIGDITGVQPGVFYTLFVPSNAAMTAAINAKLILATPDLYATATPGAKDSLNKFIQYHFLNKNTIVPDGKKTGAFATLLTNDSGDPSTVQVASTPGVMVITDNNQRKANVVVAKSNNLSVRCVIHLIDNYLKY